METIGLLAAMPQESEAFLRCFGKPKCSKLGGLPCYAFQAGARRGVLLTTGMGLRRAGAAARILLEGSPPAGADLIRGGGSGAG